ncbi:MAG: hypothetical protein AB1806_11975 [Acidobacteriota bacterium]
MRRRCVVWAVLAPLLAAGCGKGEAETALLASDEAVLRVRSEAEKYVPGEFASLVERAASARAAYDRGDYRTARQLASALPARAQEVQQAAETARTDMTARWNHLRDILPGLLNAIAEKLAALSLMRRPPTFITPEQTETSRRRLAEANGRWTAALNAFNDGDLIDAVNRAATARATLDELAALLEPVVLPAAPR